MFQRSGAVNPNRRTLTPMDVSSGTSKVTWAVLMCGTTYLGTSKVVSDLGSVCTHP